LPRDLVGRLEVGLQDRLLDVAAPFVPAGVNVDGHQRLGFVDHDITATLQPDLAMEGVVDLLLHAERFEDRRGAVIKLNAVARPARDLPDHGIHPVD
jgi:hypothetical protein